MLDQCAEPCSVTPAGPRPCCQAGHQKGETFWWATSTEFCRTRLFFLYSLPNLSCFPPNLPNFTNFTKIYQSTKNCKFVLQFQPISLIILFRLDGVSKHRKISKCCPEYISSVVEVSSCFYQKNVSCFARNWVVRIWVF